MKAKELPQTYIDQRVTYTLELEGKVVIVERVPARVCVETGERFYAPDTVEVLQKLIWEKKEPDRVVKTPVYDFAA